MPAITATNMNTAGAVTVTEVTLDGATDTFTYTGGNAIIEFINDTAGALSPVIIGDAATSVSAPGVPGGVDVSAGYSVGSIGIGESVNVKLSTIKGYLSGNLSVTSGTGLTARLLEF